MPLLNGYRDLRRSTPPSMIRKAAIENPAAVPIQSQTGAIGLVSPLNVVMRNMKPSTSMMSPSTMA